MIACNHLAIFFVFFNLNGCMKNFIIFLTNLIDIFNDLLWVFRSYMTSHDKFSSSQAPAMEIMNFIYQFQVLNLVVKLYGIYFLRRSLHYNFNTFDKNWNSSDHYKNREKKCTNWICNLPFRFEFNDDRSTDNANTLNHISKKMDKCCLYIQILFLSLIFFSFILFNLVKLYS